MVTSWKDITAEQYAKLMDLKDENEIIEIVFNKPLKEIPLSEISNEGLAFLKTDPPKSDIRFFTHNGVKYGMAKFDQLSLGEYIDLTSLASDWQENIWKMMAILYRPIVGWNLKHKCKFQLGKLVYGVGLFSGSKKWENYGTKLLMNLDYKITKYEGDPDMEKADIFKTMSASQFNSFLVFFSQLSLRKTHGILKSLELKIPPKKASPKKPKQNSPSKAGDGTTSSTQSRTRKSGSKTKSSK